MKIQIDKYIKNTYIMASFFFILSLSLYLLDLPSNYNNSWIRTNHRRMISSQDAFPTTFVPYTLIKYKTFAMNKAMMAFEKTQDTIKIPYYVIKIGDNIYSKYPIFTGILATPIYFIPLILNKIPNIDTYDNLLKILLLGRIAAAFYTSISVAIFYILLRRISEINKENNYLWSIIFTIFYAFGTTSYSISTRALWQHTGAQFLISLALLTLISGLYNRSIIIWSGIFLGMAVLARPTTIILAIFIFLYFVFNQKKNLYGFIISTIPTVLFLFAYNYFAFGNIFTQGYEASGDTAFNGNVVEGIIGLLASPTHGILFVSPPLLLFIPFLYKIYRKKVDISNLKNFITLEKYLGYALIVHIILISSWWCWYGGDSFGYRMLTEYLPIISIFAYQITSRFNRIIKGIIIIFMIYSIYANMNSVISYISRCETSNLWELECLIPGKKTLNLFGIK